MKRITFIISAIIWITYQNSANAYDFESNGIAYNVVSFSENTIEIAQKDGGYSGEFDVPEYVMYNDRSLKVLGFGEGALNDCHISSLYIHNSIYFKISNITTLLQSLESVNVDDIKVWLESTYNTTDPIRYEHGYISVHHLLYKGAALCVAGDTLKELVIPSSIRNVRYACFYGYKYIQSIRLHKTLESIKDYAFRACPKIKFLSIPNSIKTIGYYALCNTDTLRIEDGLIDIKMYENYSIGNDKLYIGRKITHYPDRGFNIVSSTLKELEIGSYVDTIPQYRRNDFTAVGVASFKDADLLSSIIVHRIYAPVGPTFHNQAYMNAILSIPPGTKDSFGWNNFWNKREDASEGWKAQNASNASYGDFEESIDICGWQANENIKWNGHCIFIIYPYNTNITTLNRIRFKPGEYVLKFRIWSTGLQMSSKLYRVNILGKEINTYLVLGDLVGHKFEVRFNLQDEIEDFLSIDFGVQIGGTAPQHYFGLDELELYDIDTYYVINRHLEKENGLEDINGTTEKEEEYYSIDGRKLKQPQHGINIVRHADGSIKKYFTN